jgi:glycine/D-amino acid oxidase-like deaminating enzyme/nitrite reductase/ring-hydroxylating ferredoxin subunit
MESLWLSTTRRSADRFASAPREGVEVDVAIIGGGICGVTSAYLLREAGLKVAVLESRRVACGETGHTTAHLTAIQDADFTTLRRKFGKGGVRRIASAGMDAIDLVERLVRTRRIDCDFERMPAWIYSEHERDLLFLARQARAAREAGLDCEKVDRVPLPFEVAGGVRFEHQARFHPRSYVLALARAVDGDGSHIFERTHVLSVEDGDPCIVRLKDGGFLRARRVISAADAVVVNRFFLQTKLAPHRTYAIAMRLDAELSGLFYDTDDPYHYIRTHPSPEGPLVIVGGEDHRVGEKRETAEAYDRLEAWTKARFGEGEVLYRWSGQVLEPLDGLPYIGRNPFSQNLYVGTGFSGNGMVNGTLAGMVLTDVILGRENPYARMLQARRLKPLASAAAFVVNNHDFPKRLLLDRLPATTRDVAEILPGQGELVGEGGKKVAVYRGEDGTVHRLSPVCPHMGCHVQWNQEATSWDCPCHGSRFEATGEVIHGPATRALSRLDEDEGRYQPLIGADAPGQHG